MKKSIAASGILKKSLVALITVPAGMYSFWGVTQLAVAQDATSRPSLEEIVVTAQKKSESLQDVALTIQAFNGAQVDELNINDIEALSENMPAVTISRSGTSQRVIMRGIGSGTNDGFEQSVGVFMDGIYYGRGQQIRPKFIDIGQIETLKGPQSTLFGTNVTAGAINITSNNPTESFEGEIQGTFGEDNEREINLILSGPITSNLLGRVALYKRDDDGYVINDTLNKRVVGEDHWGGRAVLLYTPTDRLSFRAAYEYHDLDQFGNAAQIVSDPSARDSAEAITGDSGELDYHRIGGIQRGYSVVPNGPDSDTNTYHTASLRTSYEGDGFTLTSVTGYTKYDWDNVNDSEYIENPVLNFAQRTQQPFKQFSQEFRLESSLGDNFDYLLGLYYHDQDLQTTKTTEVPAFGALVVAPAQQDTETLAVFFQGTYHISDRLRSTLGLRQSSDKKDVSEQLTHTVPGLFGAFPHDIEDSRSEQHLSWLARLEYDISGDIMAYGLISRGYKAGGFDLSGLGASMGNVPAESFEYDDEQATNIEVGSKMTLLDGAATLSLSAFQTEYKGLQVTQFSGFSFDVGNAAEATVKGLEIDYRQALTDSLTASATVSWQDFEFDSYANAACTLRQKAGLDSGCVSEVQDLSGGTGQFAPDLSANLSLSYASHISNDLMFKSVLNIVYSDDYYTQLGLDPNSIQSAYTKVNARIGLASADGKWDVALVGLNLTDEVVSVNSFDSPLSTFGLPLSYVKFVLPPRTFSIQGTYSF